MSHIVPSSIHAKGWGHEEWIVNSDLYCGKFLVFRQGLRCSWHYHLLKDETFHVLFGRVRIYYSDLDDLSCADFIDLGPGQTFHVPPKLRHQALALSDAKILEISTTHYESDSYRLVKGD